MKSTVSKTSLCIYIQLVVGCSKLHRIRYYSVWNTIVSMLQICHGVADIYRISLGQSLRQTLRAVQTLEIDISNTSLIDNILGRVGLELAAFVFFISMQSLLSRLLCNYLVFRSHAQYFRADMLVA